MDKSSKRTDKMCIRNRCKQQR